MHITDGCVSRSKTILVDPDDPERYPADDLELLWIVVTCIQHVPELVPLLDRRSPEV